MTKLLDIAAKDFKVIFRDKAAFLILLGMPLALIFILGSALGGIGESDTVDIPVAIVSEDEGDIGGHFAEEIAGVEELQAVFNIDVRDDVDEVRAEVERGDLTAALVIPPGFSEAFEAGDPVEFEVLQDPGSEMTAGIWAGVARAAAANLSASQVIRFTAEDLLAAAGLSSDGMPAADDSMVFDAVTVTQAEVETERRISMIDFYAAGQTGMFMLFGAMFGAFVFAKERREQTLARVLSAPTTKLQVVGGKALGIFLVASAQFVVLFLGTRYLFGVDWGPSPMLTVTVGLAEGFATAGMAMMLAALGKTERTIGGIGPAAIMLMGVLGGAMIPVEMLPSWLLPIQAVSPVYWAVGAFLDLMHGDSTSVVVVPVLALFAIGAAMLSVGVWRLRYE